jgi:cytosine/adenosine deaminase-related metal-dependent hydrolase
MIRYHASWVVPITGVPVRDGWVLTDRERIVATGARVRGPSRGASIEEVDLGDVAIVPGLVNAHTHLELSYLRDEVPPASQFVTWVSNMMALRRSGPPPQADVVVGAIRRAIVESIACGTAVVGDISNTLVSFGPLSASALSAVLFYELIRFNTSDAEGVVAKACEEIDALGEAARVRVSLAAHAPYSVAPSVFRAIRHAIDRWPHAPCSVHLSESVEEVEFLRDASGPWRTVLEALGSWDPRWEAPGVSPVEYLASTGFLDDRVLAVHGVQMTSTDLDRLAACGATLVACPRSNGHTGAGAPPLQEFYASGVRVAVGTDSLASAPDLNVFAELATMRALAPSVPASWLLASATREGARALGFDADFGSIEPGKLARLLAVDVPSNTTDVEEYLVSGIDRAHVHWIE